VWQHRHEQRAGGLEQDQFQLRCSGDRERAFSGASGLRFQKDLNSATFQQETTIGSVELSGTDVRESSISPGQSPVTYRVVVHVGHAPNHGSVPIAGDVVSNECTIFVTFP
jgi:hypothetical protein